ncbi:MAG: queuosine precursor transporter [Candidatus Devosia phytovorans]|uniref:Probable queuosine precursor transporter n=1 Tax=Candidatus Devosia phytovorans TaxID=3121372 RepID=A0AAJ5VV16_9HYPH|nr:queuosine precursor transporter [Devosia sp.]WEK04645.1 MAG: queuosine precursor transporter [Devosia sp.]
MLARFLAAVTAMVVVVAASNILVLYPLNVTLGSINLADLLTWGAFTFPFAFLVTDLINRYDGAQRARLVALVGFVVGLGVSFYLSFHPLPWNAGGAAATTQRIATASASAFIVGQLLDISIFSRLRANRTWYVAPLLGSLFGSLIDTAIFFTLSFAPAFAGIDGLYGLPDGSLGFPAPLLGVGPEVPLWVSLAAGDFGVKFLAALLLLAPYRVLMGRIMPLQPIGARAA